MKPQKTFNKIDLAKFGDYIKKNKTPLMFVGGAIVVVIIGVSLTKNIKETVNDFFNPGNKTKGGKFNLQDIDTSKLSISSATAKNYAESLFVAFNSISGTDTGTIKEIFKKINSEDFKLIYNYFETRSYSDLNTGSPSGMILLPDTYLGFLDLDLIQWLNKELDILDYFLKQTIKKVIEPAGFILS